MAAHREGRDDAPARADRLGQDARGVPLGHRSPRVRSPSAPTARRALRVLYVSPLKALAVDVERNLRAPLAGIAEAAARLGAPLRRLDVAVRTGDTPPAERARMLRAPPDILITTPESLYLLLTSARARLLTSVDTVIVDEIHQLVATKRGAHLFLSLERLEALRPGARRSSASASRRRRGRSTEIARLLGGFEPARRSERGDAAPVAIVDASAKKALSITVEVPPPPARRRLGAAELDDADADGPSARIDLAAPPRAHRRAHPRALARR